MTPRRHRPRAVSEPRWCNRIGCGVHVQILYRQPEGQWRAYESGLLYPDVDPIAGCDVLLNGHQAWDRGAALEHYRVRFEVDEPRARALVGEFPHVRPHLHDHTTATTEEIL